MTNKNKTVLYTGVTSNLKYRVWQHENHDIQYSFTSRYNVEYIIYYESFDTIEAAIGREKILKGWSRAKKEALINTKNKEWRFLNDEISQEVYTLLY